MKIHRIFETVLYADDLVKAKAFYSDVLGMNLIRESELFLTYRLQQSVLLIFNPELSSKAGRSVPSHGATGPGHIAFPADEEEIALWKERFREMDIEIDAVVDWEEGGISLYVRDPAGNSVEFAPLTLWDGDWDFEGLTAGG